MVAEPFATPTTAQPSPGLATGEGHFYSDGFRPGDFKFCYGVLADLLARNPGWHLADGAVALQDGSIPPDLRDRVIVGAGLSYALGAAGGSSALSAHTHAFTQPNNHTVTQPSNHVMTQPTAHTVTQPTAHNQHALTNNHVGTAVAAHGFAFAEVSGTIFVGGTGIWIGYQNSLANITAAVSHPTVTQPTAHAALDHDHNHDGAALNNNHAGTAVDAHTGTATSAHAGGAVGAVVGSVTQMPPYAALYILVKVS